MTEINAILTALAEAPRQKAALATLVAVEGSSYRRPGARLLVLSDGQRLGSISGGCLEDDIVFRANQVLESGQPVTVTYDTTSENDIVWGVGLGCQGVVRVFIEVVPTDRPKWISVLTQNRITRCATALSIAHGEAFTGLRATHLSEELPAGMLKHGIFEEVIAPPPSLFIFGAGDDARPLVRLAKEVGWCVTVSDSRAAYATRSRFPDADEIVVAPAEEVDDRLALDEKSFVVLMTHRFAEDAKLLPRLLSQPLAYVGVLGPRKRTDRLLAQLASEGQVALPETQNRLFAPVGLDLGSTTPETIALSILAELQSCLTGRSPMHLRDRSAPIHG
jgi:xanthine dehydrogenase accessory factor